MSVTTRLSPRPSPLPRQLTPLLGRERESAELVTLLSDPSNRLITITGPGGVGKTRLALHVASMLTDEYDGAVAFVSLASIQEPSHVLPAIVQTFGVFSDAQDAPEDQLVEVLQDQLLLLVLDNFEQVRGAAPSLANVLMRCPRVIVLITSQAPLGIAGEQLFPLHPLTTPPSDVTSARDILESDAVTLFVQRARAVNPHLTIDDKAATTLAEICRRLDGLPLAIELAAARSNILSPDALLARLSNRLKVLGGERRDVPDRLRTMRNAIAWSHDLLSPDEQALFRRMSVFVGGVSLDAVEAICEPVAGERNPFDLLGRLVDHSLVRASPNPSGDARFLMLETIRDYGLEQLALLGEEDDARLGHATCMLALSEAAEPHLVADDQKEWIDRLDPDTENLRAAVDWSLAIGHEEIALRIGASNWRFCSTRGLASDCLARLEHALAAPASASSPYRANALVGAGWLASDLHDLDKARVSFEQARQLAIESGNTQDQCHALIGLGAVAHDQGDYAGAFAWHEQTAALAREIGDRRSSAMALGNMAAVYYYRGKLDDAERCWEESIAILHALGDTTTEATANSNLGSVAFERGDFARAEERLTRALILQRQVMASRDLPYTLVNLGEVWCRLGDFRRSHEAYAEAIAMWRQAASTVLEGIATCGLATLALHEDDIPRAASLVLESTRIVAEAGDQRCIVENAEVLAGVCAKHGAHAMAVELMAAAAGIRAELGAEPNPLKVSDLQCITSATRAALDDHAHERAWETGSQLDLDALSHHIGVVGREILGSSRARISRTDPGEPTETDVPVITHDLTNRELEVLHLLAQGHSTGDISEALFISPRTTTTHIANILGKFGVTSRTAAVAHALRIGLV